MKNKRTFFKRDIVRNYLRRFPNLPSLTIAKKIFGENSEHFKDAEDVRSVVRELRGLSGKKARKEMKDKTFYVKPFSLNPFKFPKSDAEKLKVFTLPREHNNILVLSDLHIPFHDISALTAAFKYGKDNNINTIFINGDLLDFYQISRFEKIDRKRSVRGELEMAKEFLDILNREFPNVPIYFLKGNHDNRLEHYLATKAPELLDVPEFRLEQLLDAKAHNMRVFDDKTLVKMGKLNITHGHLLIKGVFAPVNAARGTFLRAKASTMISHVHKVSMHSETTINGKLVVCYSTGCLCELTPAYNPFGNNYAHGFAHVIVEPNGIDYTVHNKHLLNGKFIA